MKRDLDADGDGLIDACVGAVYSASDSSVSDLLAPTRGQLAVARARGARRAAQDMLIALVLGATDKSKTVDAEGANGKNGRRLQQ